MIQPYNLSRLAGLQAALQPIARTFLEQAEAAGIPVTIVQSLRTMEQQQVHAMNFHFTSQQNHYVMSPSENKLVVELTVMLPPNETD